MLTLFCLQSDALGNYANQMAIAQPTTAYDPALYNLDLAPIPLSRRTWGIYNYASLWVAMSVCIPTYMLASA
jgi:cytosine/uracil/thiamine/allantoin permease